MRKIMTSIIYKSDIVLVFLFILFGGMFLHYLIWLHKPPSIYESELSEISYSEEKAILEEYKQARLQQSSNKNDVDKLHWCLQLVAAGRISCE